MPIRALAFGIFIGLVAAGPASATSGWGCFRVVNVDPSDVLNMRFEPSSSAPIVGTIAPQQHGIIALNRPMPETPPDDEMANVLDSEGEAIAVEEEQCVPGDRPLESRWCPVTHYTGAGTSIGWVSRRFLARSECP
jgi:hypothetical protein